MVYGDDTLKKLLEKGLARKEYEIIKPEERENIARMNAHRLRTAWDMTKLPPDTQTSDGRQWELVYKKLGEVVVATHALNAQVYRITPLGRKIAIEWKALLNAEEETCPE